MSAAACRRDFDCRTLIRGRIGASHKIRHDNLCGAPRLVHGKIWISAQCHADRPAGLGFLDDPDPGARCLDLQGEAMYQTAEDQVALGTGLCVIDNPLCMGRPRYVPWGRLDCIGRSVGEGVA